MPACVDSKSASPARLKSPIETASLSRKLVEPSSPKRKSTNTYTQGRKSRKFLQDTPEQGPNVKKRSSLARKFAGRRVGKVLEAEYNSSGDVIKPEVEELYSSIRKRFGKLGGGGAGGAIYGEVTLKSFQRIVDFMKQNCELDENSCFIDVGAGLGKPNFHVALDANVKLSVGVELGGERWWQSMILLSEAIGNIKGVAKNVFFAHADVVDMPSFEPFTHIYMFDKGFPPYLLHDLANKFNTSESCNYLMCYKKSKIIMETYSFNVEHIGQLSTSMSGSGEGNTVHFYKKLQNGGKGKATKSQRAVRKKNFGWEVPPAPKDASVAPPVAYASSYGNLGLSMMYNGEEEKYKQWAIEQVGLHRAQRRTRRAR